MSNHSPEQEAFKHNDRTDDGRMEEEVSQALSLEAQKLAGSDKMPVKSEDLKVADSGDQTLEQKLVNVMAGIAEKAARLPDEFRQQVIANNEDFIHPALLAVVKNPHDFQLTGEQNPEQVSAFLARIAKSA